MRNNTLLSIALLSITLFSCSENIGDGKTGTVWVYESGEIPEAEIISTKLTLQEQENDAYIVGYFELSIKNITYAESSGESDNITLQINFPKNNFDDESSRPAYNIKGSTSYTELIKALYEIDDTPMLDQETYPGKLRVNDELFENIIFRKAQN
jgi:hypothetical protein